jgi:hypothetical protein
MQHGLIGGKLSDRTESLDMFINIQFLYEFKFPTFKMNPGYGPYTTRFVGL